MIDFGYYPNTIPSKLDLYDTQLNDRRTVETWFCLYWTTKKKLRLVNFEYWICEWSQWIGKKQWYHSDIMI